MAIGSDAGPLFRRAQIPVVGIVGGIGSGKSAVAGWVAAQANVRVIDADSLGHDALTADNVRQSLRQRFGDEIFDSQGNVVRSALARLVFGNTEATLLARRDLEQIVHPEIERRMAEQIECARQSGCESVLLDAAVLLEAGWEKHCDAVVFIDAPDEQRLARVQQRSGWAPSELKRREASQLSLVEKRKRSDALISNDSSVSDAGKELLDFLRGRQIISCKPRPNSSQQMVPTSELLPPRS